MMVFASSCGYWVYGMYPLFHCPRAWTVDSLFVSLYGVRSCIHEGDPLFRCPRESGGCPIFMSVAEGHGALALRSDKGPIMIQLEPRLGDSPSAADKRLRVQTQLLTPHKVKSWTSSDFFSVVTPFRRPAKAVC